jgi:hypothetical protein
MSVETVGAILLGIILFEENLQEEAGLLALSLVALVVALVGLVMLSRAEGRAHPRTEPEPAPAS